MKPSSAKRHVLRAVAFSLVGLFASAALSAQTAPSEERFQRSFALASGGELSVENFKGSVQVEAWDKEEAQVDVAKHYDPDGSAGLRDWWLNETQVGFDARAGRLRVSVHYPRRDCWGDCEPAGGYVDLILRVPRRTRVQLEGHKPRMTVRGVEGDIRISSHKSPIEIDSTRGGIHIQTYKDSIRLTGVDITGKLYLSSHKGQVEVEASSLGKGAELETHKGTFVVRLPRSARVTLDVELGRRGDFDSDFPVVATTSGERLRGTVNGGGPTLRFRSHRGSLHLRSTAGSM